MPFKKGQSGNPGGRPKGLAEMVRRETQDGKIPVDFLMQVVRGEICQATVSDKIKAAQILIERGFGKAIETMQLTGEDGKPIEFAQASPLVDPAIVQQALAGMMHRNGNGKPRSV